MAESTMSIQFSKDGKYFAQISTDGKVKIWETSTSTFKQEFTPDLHLTTPCTCLHWIQSATQTPWKKRKRRQSETSFIEETNYFIALGTSSGTLLLYSFASAGVELSIDSHTSNYISCVTWEQAQDVFAGAEQFILQFDLKEKSVKTKWKTGNAKINSILLVPNKQRILTASRNIQLWNLKNKELIKTFTGHSSDVSILQFISSESSDPYFVSASKADRLLSCWSLNEQTKDKNSICNLLMEDIAMSLSLAQNSDNSTNVAAVTRSGVVHIYQLTLNGKCLKPIKPKVTIQVASDAEENKNVVVPIPIFGAFFYGDGTVKIAHGNNFVLTFENVVPNSYEKIQCLIRKSPLKNLTLKESDITKSKRPVVDETVEYLTPFTTESQKVKRKSSGARAEVPMEQRLENLTLNKSDGAIPKQDNLAQLLVQGLHSKDKTILQNVLCKRDENVVRNTVKRLPMAVIVPLLSELSALVQGKTLASQTGILWLRYLIQLHASQLLSNPRLVDMIAPVLGSIENRLSLLTPLSRLRGRLDLLVSQISEAENKDENTDEPLLLFKDQGSSDSESDENIELNFHSESENEWVEGENSETHSNGEDDNVIVDENNVSDSEMSM